MLTSKIIFCLSRIINQSVRWLISASKVCIAFVISITTLPDNNFTASNTEKYFWIMANGIIIILVLYVFSFLRKRKDKCSWIKFNLTIIFPKDWAEKNKNLVKFVLDESYCRSFPNNSFVQRFDIKSMLSSSKLKLKIHVIVPNQMSDEVIVLIYLFNLTRLTNR